MELTKTALVTFASSRDRLNLRRHIASSEEYISLLRTTLADRTDQNSYNPNKLQVGRSFIDEASAQVWVDFVTNQASIKGINVVSTEIVPYVGLVNLEVLPL